MTEAEQIRRGEVLAELLHLRRDRATGRYATQWGDKTALGLFRTVARIVNDKEEGAGHE